MTFRSHLVHRLARVGLALRRLRYRRADLRWLGASTVNAPPSPALTPRWLADAERPAGCEAVLATWPDSVVSFDVRVPGASLTTVRVAVVDRPGGSPASQRVPSSRPRAVKLTLTIVQDGQPRSSSLVLEPSPVVAWRSLAVRSLRGGDLQVMLGAASNGGNAPGSGGEAPGRGDAPGRGEPSDDEAAGHGGGGASDDGTIAAPSLAGVVVYWGDPRVESPRSWRQIADVLRRTVTAEGVSRAVERFRSGDDTSRYRRWVRQRARSAAEHRRNREWAATQRRRLTLITHAPDPRVALSPATLDAVLGQTYGSWEWLVALPAASAPPETLGGVADARIRVLRFEQSVSFAGAYNAALAQAEGDFVGILGAGDTLAAEALYEVARTLELTPDADVIYSDEDRASPEGRHAPTLKPAWSPDFLLAMPYVGRLAMCRRSRLQQLGGVREGIEGSEEWDLYLRLARVTTAFHRIPRCLYHRWTPPPVPTNVDRVLGDHCATFGAAVRITRVGDSWRSQWVPPEAPLVSIVVPNRDAPEVMGVCARGILEGTAYPRRELIIVDNGSTHPETLALYDRLIQAGLARLVPFNRPFNFSAACNAGAAAASGELLLFLNNDIEVIEPEWLDELVRWALRPEVGVVGAQLLYPDRTIQHAGVIVGLGLVGHIYSRAGADVRTPFGGPHTYRNYLAVTGACQLLRRDVFERLGGFDEGFRISFSDVVLCLRAWTAGYRVVYTPYARLVHHESYTRQRDDAPQDTKRLAAYLRTNGFEDDPFFHPELNPRSVVPTLRPAVEADAATAVRGIVDRTLTADMGAQ